MNLTIEQHSQLQLALRERLKLDGLIKTEVKTINRLLDLLKSGNIIVVDSHETKSKEFARKVFEEL